MLATPAQNCGTNLESFRRKRRWSAAKSLEEEDNRGMRFDDVGLVFPRNSYSHDPPGVYKFVYKGCQPRRWSHYFVHKWNHIGTHRISCTTIKVIRNSAKIWGKRIRPSMKSGQ